MPATSPVFAAGVDPFADHETRHHLAANFIATFPDTDPYEAAIRYIQQLQTSIKTSSQSGGEQVAAYGQPEMMHGGKGMHSGMPITQAVPIDAMASGKGAWPANDWGKQASVYSPRFNLNLHPFFLSRYGRHGWHGWYGHGRHGERQGG
jgi:hypothetical protein